MSAPAPSSPWTGSRAAPATAAPRSPARPAARGARRLAGHATLLGLLLAGAPACSLLGGDDDGPRPLPAGPAVLAAAENTDLALRVAERVARPERLGEGELFLEIERLMPAWQAEQRRGRAEPVEHRLTQEVVAHFDMLTAALRSGTHERRVVAAWALGFSRVPPNDVGVSSPHMRAVTALVAAMPDADDEVMQNVLVALWRLGDPNTPLLPLVEVLALHHDPAARANAALALAAVVTRHTLPQIEPAVRTALGDSDPKVRLHATNVAVAYPRPEFTRVLVARLPDEPMPLVRARMAEALGRSGDRSTARVLLPLLDRGDALERALAHQALVSLYGVDRGPSGHDWRDLVTGTSTNLP